ncbi:MAG: type II toxin-antitoxin system ParD family antitoxin [Bacteroidia bacterium]|nr:type II toxin-antitoxin system ParD family antitoxin [Bacteroidia bacterium]
MNISLTAELEALVKAKVDSGLYNNASEVIREALRLLHEADQIKSLKMEILKKELKAGIESLEKGNGNSKTIEQIANEVLHAPETD